LLLELVVKERELLSLDNVKSDGSLFISQLVWYIWAEICIT